MKKIFTALLMAMLVSTSAFALNDVSDSTRNSTAIKFLNQRGIVGGYPDGTFQPAKTVSRAEMTKILVGATGAAPTVETYKNCFPDVKEEWFAPFVCYAKEKGWVGGYPDGTFKPGKEVSKVEAIKILVGAQGLELESSSDIAFDDADKAAWYAPYLATAIKKGLLEASNGKYGIGEYISRGEVSENIYRSVIVKEKGLSRFDGGTPTADKPASSEGSYKVVKVVDGDTVDVEMNGTKVRLRLIGIDTPETVDPRKPVQCFGKEASDRAKSVLTGKTVTLEADTTQGDKDSYGRLLRYVILADGTNFNKKMIEDGYAFEYTYNKPYKYQDAFEDAENSARENENGLWAYDTCDGVASDVDDSNDDYSDSDDEYSEDEEESEDDEDEDDNRSYSYKVSVEARSKYYCETDSAWKNLKSSNVVTYSSESELRSDYPGLTLNKPC
jgi:micrococcal nuclease